LLVFLLLRNSGTLIKFTIVIAFPVRTILRILLLINGLLFLAMQRDLYLLSLLRSKIREIYPQTYVSIVSISHM
jgi:hypothetical protein